MRVRYSTNPDKIGYFGDIADSSSAMVYWGDDLDYAPIDSLEIEVADQTWVNLRLAMSTRRVIPNQYDRHFRYTTDDKEIRRGYYIV